MEKSKYIKIEAIQIAEAFNIKKMRADFHTQPHSSSPSETFYTLPGSNRYLYIFDYGVVVLANYSTVKRKELINFVKNYSTTIEPMIFSEEYRIEIDDTVSKVNIKNDFVVVPFVSADILKIVMLNIAQSVALDYYEMLTADLISSSKVYILELEQHGKLHISKVDLLKYIGKVLNIKNSIVDNLYILDDPNLVWDNKDLDILNRQLKANFDINPRFKDLDYRLGIVEDNLKLFTDVLNVRESSRLEWIIIILIFIEMMVALIFHFIG